MLTYKYRSGNNSCLDRDISSLIENYIYVAPFKDLNDPNEGMCNETISDACRLIEDYFRGDASKVRESLSSLLSFKNSVGVYSMSKTPFDCGMWKNYAGDSNGFCIEYDLEKLCENTLSLPNWDINILEVDYRNQFPTVTIDDIHDRKKFLTKLYGTKLKNWQGNEWHKEQEIRIIKDQFGRKPYHPSALKAIYFGEKCQEDIRNRVIVALSGRDVKFYVISKNGNLLSTELIAENKRDISRLDKKDFELITSHAPVVENFIIIYKPEMWTKEEITNFVDLFTTEYTTKQANIWIYDSAVDKSLLSKWPTFSHDEFNNLESHKIAEKYFGGDEIDFEKHYNL